MVEYKPETYKNHSDSLTRIKKLSTRISSNLTFLGIDYLNKISGDFFNKRFNEISHSLTLRISSIIFHYEILHSIYTPNRKLTSDDWNPMVGDQFAIRQKFLFDSIIFNSLSAFDYFSCLITYSREKNKDNWRKMWTSLVRYTRNNNDFKQTTLGGKIIDIDKIWLNKLSEYRAELIHYDTDNLPVSSKWEVMNGKVDILVKAPNNLKKVFKTLSEIEKHEDFNINSVSLWIIETCLMFLVELTESFKVYIEEKRLIPEEKAIITFKK